MKPPRPLPALTPACVQPSRSGEFQPRASQPRASKLLTSRPSLFRPQAPRPKGRTRHSTALLLALLLALLPVGGCGFLGGLFGGGEPTEPADQARQEEDAGKEGADPKDPFGAGVLNRIAEEAEPGSVSQFLARLAAQFGWEEQIAQNTGLRKAIEGGQFKERVEPYLLGVFFQNGFSVLPMVGEGHQFNRDTVVRGAVGATRLLVTTRDPVRIIFLSPVSNVQIVYHQDGKEPQVFSVNEQATVAVRQSLHKYYLR